MQEMIDVRNVSKLTVAEIQRHADRIYGKGKFTFPRCNELKERFRWSRRRIIVTCPVHGDFETELYPFLNPHRRTDGYHAHHFYGCKKCVSESLSISREELQKKIDLVHGAGKIKLIAEESYRRSGNYKAAFMCTKPGHRIFITNVNDLLDGCAHCPKCTFERREKEKEARRLEQDPANTLDILTGNMEDSLGDGENKKAVRRLMMALMGAHHIGEKANPARMMLLGGRCAEIKAYRDAGLAIDYGNSLIVEKDRHIHEAQVAAFMDARMDFQTHHGSVEDKILKMKESPYNMVHLDYNGPHNLRRREVLDHLWHISAPGTLIFMTANMVLRNPRTDLELIDSNLPVKSEWIQKYEGKKKHKGDKHGQPMAVAALWKPER